MEMQFCNVPADCRANILSYLSPTDLYASYARVCRFCHADSLNSELPQHLHFGEFNVGSDGEICMERLLQRIIHSSFQIAWQSPRCHMKIIGHEIDSTVISASQADDLSFEEMRDIASEVAFHAVTSLDMSVSHGEDSSSNRVLPRSLPWLLSTILPDLIELDFTNLHGGPVNEGDYISELSLFNSTKCPHIRKVTWNERVGGCYFLRGKDMKSLVNLNELYMDNILCDWRFDKLFAPLMNQFFEEDSRIQRFFFFACNSNLERVSLKGGRYIGMDGKENDFPQFALIRFVRRTPTLKWFRSDLTEQNIISLSKERPEICFL